MRSASQERSTFIAAVVIVALGILWRVLWLAHQRPFEVQQVEAVNAAVEFARSGRFANALGPGEGPTAHLNPIMPLFSGLVYKLLGVQTHAANWLLSLVALALSLGSALMLYRAFGKMGGTTGGRLFGLGLYCLLPLGPFVELMEFRHWEGGLTAFLAAALLLLAVEYDAALMVEWSRRLCLAALAALLFFVNPPVGIAGYALLALLFWRRLDRIAQIKSVAACGGVLVLVLMPWTIRNYVDFHRFVPLRANAGLELALANHPAAVTDRDPKAVFLSRLYDIHPNNNPRVFTRMQAAGGEIPYAQMLGRTAKEWIVAHPGQFLRLTLRHCAQFYFPPAWQWSVYGAFGKGTAIKQAAMWLLAAAGLLGAALSILRWRGRMIYAAPLALLPAFPYSIVQPILRYHYLVLGILIFLAAEVLVRAIRSVTAPRVGVVSPSAS